MERKGIKYPFNMITVIGIVGIITGIGTWDMLKQIKRIKDV